jgi:ribonuclease E
MKKEMLINVLQPEECRIAIVEDGVLEELNVERTSHESYVGNIYKGRIVNIEPSIQAAFVDFGVGRNGFLHVSDVEPTYYRHIEQRRPEGGGRRGGNGRDRERGHDRHRRPPRSSGPRAEREEPEAPPVADELLPPEGEHLLPGTAVEPGTPPAAEPQAPEPGPHRRRPRGGRRRREEMPETSPETAASEPTQESTGPAPESAPEPAMHEEPPPPRLMDSAERRTEEDDEADAQTETPPISDDDLFFPRAQEEEPPQEAPETHARPEPEAAEAVAEEEPPLGRPEDEMEEERRAEELVEERLPDFGEDEVAEEEEAPHRRGPRRHEAGRRGRFRGGRPGAGRPKPPIQEIFRRGQEVLVQVIKEGIGTKGPTLSTYISIAGRYLVLMPYLNRIGVSRKIIDDESRRRQREILRELNPPEGLGFVIRTAAMDRTKKELQRDLAYLVRLWQVVVRRIRKLKAPAEIYQESDMITRTIRDTFTSEVDTIWVDEPAAFEHAQEFAQIVMPRYANRIKLYTGSEPLFHKYGLEHEIARIQQRHVPLPNGGSIVIEQTEALVAIDVNSGNFRADNNAEETAYQMNLLAAKEIARQLRLRNLGGVIVNDFIDMREERHKRAVEKALRDALKRDRARIKVLKMSAFGIIEMTRQRQQQSLKRSVYQECPSCLGNGQVKTWESMSIDVMRLLQLAAHREHVARVAVRVTEDVATYLLNKKRREVTRLEESGDMHVQITPVPGGPPELMEFMCYDNNNNEIKLLPHEEERPRRRRPGSGP